MPPIADASTARELGDEHRLFDKSIRSRTYLMRAFLARPRHLALALLPGMLPAAALTLVIGSEASQTVQAEHVQGTHAKKPFEKLKILLRRAELEAPGQDGRATYARLASAESPQAR